MCPIVSEVVVGSVKLAVSVSHHRCPFAESSHAERHRGLLGGSSVTTLTPLKRAVMS